VDGEPNNIGRRDLKEYIERVGRIKPQEVHLYSIDRPVPNDKISLVPPDKLKRLASRITKETGVAAQAFYG
jgi:hypothetical protein